MRSLEKLKTQFGNANTNMLIESNDKFKSYLLNDFDSDHEDLISYTVA